MEINLFRRLGYTRRSWNFGLCLPGLMAFAAQAQSPDTLTLDEALRLAENHPSLEAARLEEQASAREASRVGRFSNPRFSLEGENVAGTGSTAGVRALETTVRLEQSLELGGKTALRRVQAEAEKEKAVVESGFRRRVFASNVHAAFAEYANLQGRETLLADGAGFLRSALEVARRRKAAGGGGVGEEEKLQLQLALVELDSARNVIEMQGIRRQIAQWTGLPGLPVLRPDSNLMPLRDSAEVLSRLEYHPDLMRWKVDQEILRLSERSAKAQNTPDLDVNAGVRHLGADGDWAIVGGISLPLPLWNRNQASIAGAGLRVRAGDRAGHALRRELESKGLGYWAELRSRRRELERFRAQLLPQAERMRSGAQAAYAGGRLGIWELLESQKTWLELHERHLALLADYRAVAVKLEALAGGSTLMEERKGNTP